MFSYKLFSQDYPRRAAYCVTMSVAAVATILVAFLAVKTVGAWLENSNIGNQNYGPSIGVRGEGKVVVTPESSNFIATFSYGVQTTSESVETAQDDATKRINAASEYLKSQGVKKEDIKTTSYDVNPHYEWIEENCRPGVVYCPRGKSIPVGFDVNQTVTVKIRDIKKAGEILAGIGKKEVTNISGLTFTVDDLEKVRDEARKLAIEDAKARAKTMEDALGINLRKIQGMYDIDQGFGGPYPMMAEGYGGDMNVKTVAAVAPEVTPGEREVIVRIEIQYAIDN